MGFIYKVASPMEKVFSSASDVPALGEKVLSGLKGETVSFQIAYFWDDDRKNCGFCQVDSPLKEQIRIREVRLVPCEYPCHRKRDGHRVWTVPGSSDRSDCVWLPPGSWSVAQPLGGRGFG